MDFSKISEPFKKSYASLKTAGLQFIVHQKNLSFTQHFSEYQTANNAESLGALKQAGTLLKSMIQIKGMTEKIKQIPANFILSQLIPNTQITPLKQMRLEAAKNQQEAYQAGQAIHQKLTKIWNMKGEDLLASASNKLNHAILETTLPLLNPSPEVRGQATGALKFEIASWFVGMGEVKAASKITTLTQKGILAESKSFAEAGLKIFGQVERKILPATEELMLKSVVGSTEKRMISSLLKPIFIPSSTKAIFQSRYELAVAGKKHRGQLESFLKQE